MDLYFKKGSRYTRKHIGEICYPGKGRPSGGNWSTGYVRVEENLIIFMNIGVPGRGGYDYDNYFDEITNTIIWYGKPRANSGQPLIKGVLEKKIRPYIFARWDSTDPNFVYLGIGSVVSFEDDAKTKKGEVTIRVIFVVDEGKDVLIHSRHSAPISTQINQPQLIRPSSFVFEKHLEDYLCKNWEDTILGDKYKIYKNGRQYQTDTGPMDILAQRKDMRGFMVVELKREKASDIAVAQTLRYINFVRNNLATNHEEVKGCIIATEQDRNLMNAIAEVPNIDFYRYQINFSLNFVNKTHPIKS